MFNRFSVINQIKTIAINDFKLIFRDVTLKLFFILPIILIAMAIWFVPILIGRFDYLDAYTNLILIIFIIENTQAFCIINSLLFIEETESQTSKVYGVLPLSKKLLIVARFFLPYVFTVLFNAVLLSFQNLVEIDFVTIVMISFMAALIVPIYVLLLSSYAKNRLEGMIYIKLFNLLVLLPMVAFFIDSNWSMVFGALPTYWLYQSIDTGLNVDFQSESFWFAGIYMFYCLVFLRFSVNRFIKTQFI